MNRAEIDSPLGRVCVEATDAGLTALSWRRGATGPCARADAPILHEAAAQLDAYFAGTRTAFDLPIAPRESAFQTAFMAALSAIPFGETRTYGDLAAELGVSAQALGQACGANPVPIVVPCHRVLGANGLGGFSGHDGVEAKVWLLRHEGAASLLI